VPQAIAELGTKGLAAFKMFRDTYLNMNTGAERSAAAAFERMYPGQGDAARAENSRAPSQEAMQAASRMSSRECSNVVTGFEAMAVADDFSVVVPRAMIPGRARPGSTLLEERWRLQARGPLRGRRCAKGR
jgi:hypothetical protein